MNYTFKVGIPTDEGFVGQKCKNPKCEKYFKIFHESHKDRMYCPYCAQEHNYEDLLTDDQVDFIRDNAIEKGKELVVDELNKLFDDLARKNKNIKFKGNKYRPKNVNPKYTEKTVDVEIKCTRCETKFQVYGVFGYCPGCKSENIQIYDANFEIIKRELENSKNSRRGLRHAYSDLVSTFQIVCEKNAKRVSKEKANFQDLFETRRFFKKKLGIDILSNLRNEEELSLKRIFQKRHIYIHSGGVIGDMYIKKVPEDSHLIGQEAELTKEEFENGVEAIKKVLSNLIEKTA